MVAGEGVYLPTKRVKTGYPYHPLKILFFLKGSIFKSLLNLLQYCFCLMFWFFGGILRILRSLTGDWTRIPCIGRLRISLDYQGSVSLKILNWSLNMQLFGEGNGNPLQCSCLENPSDRGASWAAVYGVAQSWTRLKRLSSSSSSMQLFDLKSTHFASTPLLIPRPSHYHVSSTLVKPFQPVPWIHSYSPAIHCPHRS